MLSYKKLAFIVVFLSVTNPAHPASLAATARHVQSEVDAGKRPTTEKFDFSNLLEPHIDQTYTQPQLNLNYKFNQAQPNFYHSNSPSNFYLTTAINFSNFNSNYNQKPEQPDTLESLLKTKNSTWFKFMRKLNSDYGSDLDSELKETKREIINQNYNSDGLAYLKSIDLCPCSIFINDRELNKEFSGFINEAGLWSLINGNKSIYHSLITKEFNLSVKHFGPIITELANNKHKAKASELFSGLKNIFNFSYGLLAELGNQGIQALKEAPLSIPKNLILKAVTGTIFIPIMCASMAWNLTTQTKQAYSDYNSFINAIYTGNFDEAGRFATKCGLCGLQFRQTYKCFSGFYNLAKNINLKNCMRDGIKTTLALFHAPQKHLIDNNLLVDKARAANYNCKNHKDYTNGRASGNHSLIVKELDALKLSKEETAVIQEILSKNMKETITTKRIEHIFHPDVQCIGGQAVGYSGFHHDYLGKIQNSGIFDVKIIKELPNGMYELGWTLHGKLRTSTHFHKNLTRLDIAKNIVNAYKNPQKIIPNLKDKTKINLIGKTSSNILINFAIKNETNEIISIFPINEF